MGILVWMTGVDLDQDRVGEILQAGTTVLGEMSPGFLWVFVRDKKGEIRCFVYPFCHA